MEEENKSTEEFYCTECKRIVKEEDLVCPYCGADLSETVEAEEKVYDDEKMGEVVVKVFNNEIEAQLAKGQLDAEGINCFIMTDNFGEAFLISNIQVGFKLIVNEYNYEKAVEVLKAMEMF